MHILIWWDQKQSGGVDSHLLSLLLNWPSSDDKFTIFYNSKNLGASRIFPLLNNKSNVKLVKFSSTNDFDSGVLINILEVIMFPFFFSFLILYAYAILYRVRGAHILVANNGSYPGAWSCLAALIAGRLLHISKRVLLVHHCASTPRLFWESVEKFIDRAVLGSVNSVLAVSRATRTTLMDIRGFNTVDKPIHVIHNGVSTKFDASSDGGHSIELRKVIGLCDGVNLIAIVSRLEQYKGHEDLLLGFADLPKAVQSQFHICFIGQVDLVNKKYLTNLVDFLGIKNKVSFLGYIAGDSGLLIQQLDILLMLTRDFEGFGLTIAEAMASGTPVIATNVGGVGEFANSDCVYLIPPASPSAIAEALLTYYQDKSLFLKRAEIAKDQIKKFSASKMARNFRKRFWIG